jgi:hypothetical protein
MSIGFTTVSAEDTGHDILIANDIDTALTLQGIDCDGISELEQNDENSYDVVCESGGSFSISQTEGGVLSVVDQLTGIALKSIGTILSVVPLMDQIFQQSNEITEQEAEVARSLFSIIELSGYKCDVITGVVKNTADEHVVTCVSDRNYHVYTTEDGLVAVEVISNNGD